MAVAARAPHAGQLLREWRARRNLSQLQLAPGSAVSARHLSFIETGRARPSREMVLHLAERLEIPLRERNRLLLAAGFAPPTASARSTVTRCGPSARRSSASWVRTSPTRRSCSTGTGTLCSRMPRSRRCSTASPRTCSSRRRTRSARRCTRTGWRRGSSTSTSGALISSTGCAARSHSRGDAELELLLGRGARVSGRARTSRRRSTRWRPPRSCFRCTSSTERPALLLQHADDLRHCSRRHARRARGRGVLPRRRRDRRRTRGLEHRALEPEQPLLERRARRRSRRGCRSRRRRGGTGARSGSGCGSSPCRPRGRRAARRPGRRARRRSSSRRTARARARPAPGGRTAPRARRSTSSSNSCAPPSKYSSSWRRASSTAGGERSTRGPNARASSRGAARARRRTRCGRGRGRSPRRAARRSACRPRRSRRRAGPSAAAASRKRRSSSGGEWSGCHAILLSLRRRRTPDEAAWRAASGVEPSAAAMSS